MFTVALFIIAKTWKQHRCSSVNERIRKLIYTKRERERERDSQVAQCKRIHLPMQETCLQSLGQEEPLGKEMATHASILAWEIPWIEEPDRLQSVPDVTKSWTQLSK